MTIQASGRSALIIAAAFVLGLVGTGFARAAEQQSYSPFLPVGSESAPAAKQDGFPAPMPVEAQAQAAPAAESADAAPSDAPAASEVTVNMVTVSNDDSSGWDKASIIGKIFIACGTLLTLGSAARMFMI
ncbi:MULTISPECIES: hypothetical protein [unclassified Bradyrhizobium]|uniref:hypothetical protein n=1 Tax=unclassified Bradyrhizobium TaxID=2631580 RepID=UPI0028EA95A9|nr:MULTISPECIES: hypothetical protein [unclassified Bradyrhizobium]